MFYTELRAEAPRSVENRSWEDGRESIGRAEGDGANKRGQSKSIGF
jgi:hypothetical protein